MKKNKNILLAMLIFLCLFITLVAVKKSKSYAKPYDKNIFALDTFINLQIYSDDAERVADLAESKINELEKILSVTDSESDISKLNNSGGKTVKVCDDTLNVIRTAVDISNISDGALDISIYPIIKLWGFTTDTYAVPVQSDISKELERVDYSKIIVDENMGTVQLSKDMQIDLGAVAKGYISEQVKNLLKESGVKSAVLSFGGNVQTIGTKNGKLWKVGIKYPFTEGSFAYLSEGETAIVTSATDQRYFEENGKMYHHIIDPKSGYPVDNENYSVTVVCDSGARADALSTSLFVMGIKQAKELYKNYDGFEFVILDKNDNIYITSGLKDSFKLAEKYENLNIELINK